jgi:hypothetical protein
MTSSVSIVSPSEKSDQHDQTRDNSVTYTSFCSRFYPPPRAQGWLALGCRLLRAPEPVRLSHAEHALVGRCHTARVRLTA